MKEIALDFVAELLSFVMLGLVGSVLGIGGVLMEENGLSSVLSGELAIGLWYIYMGGLALYIAVYMIGFREIPHRVAAIRSRAEEHPGKLDNRADIRHDTPVPIDWLP